MNANGRAWERSHREGREGARGGEERWQVSEIVMHCLNLPILDKQAANGPGGLRSWVAGAAWVEKQHTVLPHHRWHVGVAMNNRRQAGVKEGDVESAQIMNEVELQRCHY